MKLVSKATIAKFSNQSYSMESMMELMGRQPHHIAGYIRLKKQFSLGLLTITEALGNVYMEEKGYTKLKDIDTYSFTWDVETSQIPTVRFTRNVTDNGSSKQPMYVYINERYFSKYDIFALENTQQLYVLEEPERITDNEWRYLVVNAFHSSVDTNYMTENRTARYVTNAHPEFSEYGTNKQHYNTERHINYLTKIRAGQPYSGDFRATQDLYFTTDEDAKKIKEGKTGFKIFKLSSIEQQVLDHFLISANGSLLMGRSSVDESTGRSSIQLSNMQNVITGDGIIAQYERYAHYIDYTNGLLHVKDFQDAIENICERRGQSQGNHITVICNRRFSRQKATALQNAINTFAASNNGTWFFSKDTGEVYGAKDAFGGKSKMKQVKVMPHDVSVGSTFNTYIYEGNTITFIVDEALTNHYQDRGYAIFIDTGIYEDETGQVPAVHLKTLKGRALVKNYITGMGGVDGRSNGQVSTASDFSRFEVLGWRGACVRNPYAATIMVESV